MKRTLQSVVLFALVCAMSLALPSSALAFVQRTGDSITVAENVSDDLYVFGSAIDIIGDVDGDVVVFGQYITVSGRVTGDVIAAGQTVRIDGPVGGSIRAAGESVEVAGMTDEDVVLAGNTVRLREAAAVGRDAVVAGRTVSLQGPVERNVLAGAGALTLASEIGGNMRADVDELSVTQDGRIGGDLDYYSSNEAQIDGSVDGQTRRHPARYRGDEPDRPDPFSGLLLAIFHWIRWLVGMTLFAILVILLLQGFSTHAAEELLGRPLPSLGIGLLITLLALPIAGLVFLLGLFIGGWWIAFVILAVAWLLGLVGTVIGALAIGRWVLGRFHRPHVRPLWAALLGVVLIWLIRAIPIIGWLAGGAVTLFGMGSFVLAAWTRRQSNASPRSTAPGPMREEPMAPMPPQVPPVRQE